MIERLARGIDRRLDAAGFVDEKADKVFPESWTFLFGEVALYALVALLLTGVYLAMFFDPSMGETVYQGSYAPLVGVEMSEAYASALELSFDVQAGLFIRQVHHWAALLFVASIVVHLLRVFFTGAFRKPRDINWVVGCTLLVLGIVEGFAGYSLLDDVLSGVGVRIMHAMLESIPVVGPDLAWAAFGGPFPGEAIIGRLYAAHTMIIPAILVGLVGVHLAMVFRQVHTQYPGPGRREDNVVGLRLWPSYAARSVGLLFLVGAVLALLGGFFQINPVWLWGPYEPYLVTTAAQPDWYMGWLEGALRLSPPFEPRVGSWLLPQPFLPAVVLPGLVFGTLFAWPWIERRVTGDDAEHHLLERPRDNPGRTAFGAGALAFLSVLFLAGSQDVIALILDVPLRPVTWTLRGAALVLPPVVAAVTYRWCASLRDSGMRPAGEDAYEHLDREPSDA